MLFINVVVAFGPGKEESFRIHMRNEVEDCGLSEYLEVGTRHALRYSRLPRTPRQRAQQHRSG